MRTEFLFLPTRVVELLRDLPDLGRALGDPCQEGVRSRAFPKARKSQRQIYRVCGNVHFPQLRELLRSLDLCIGRGFHQPALIKTRSRSDFGSALSELAVAEHLLGRGFLVENARPAGTAIPDIIARQDDLAIAVEVYSPCRWAGLDDLMDLLTDAVKHLDEPLDFVFEVRVRQREHVDADGHLLSIHPATLSRGLDAQRRTAIAGALLRDLRRALAGGPSELLIEHDARDLNIRVAIELREVQRSRNDLPIRGGAISPPSLSGYAPDAMFDHLVHRGVQAKAKKGQAPASNLAPWSALVVDLARSQLQTELADPAYRRRFEQTLREWLGSGLHGHDLVAFCSSAPTRGLQLHYVLTGDQVPGAVGAALFPRS